MPLRTNRLERITNLLLVLLDTNHPLSLREIGATVAGYSTEPGALRQAFERDKRTLRDEGIPIATERIDGEDQVGYRILPEQYYLPDLHLDSDEQEAIAFALAAVRLDAGVSRDVGAKLGAMRSGVLPPVVELPTLPFLGILQEAIRTRAAVTFDYHDRQRVVAGYGLAFKWGSWYFVGRYEESDATGAGQPQDELRTFRVDRMTSMPSLGEPAAYEVPEGFDLARQLRFAPFLSSGDSNEVTIDVDVREVRRVLAIVGFDARIDGATPGSMRLRFAVGDTEGFISWVLGLGESVEVIDPPKLREAVIERLIGAISPPEPLS